MVKGIRTRQEKLRDKEAQLKRMADANIAWGYGNTKLKVENERLRTRLEYLEKMEREIIDDPGEKIRIRLT